METAGYVRWDAWACLETLKEVTKALIFLHENRILHGDLKVPGARTAARVVREGNAGDRWRCRASYRVGEVLQTELTRKAVRGKESSSGHWFQTNCTATRYVV